MGHLDMLFQPSLCRKFLITLSTFLHHTLNTGKAAVPGESSCGLLRRMSWWILVYNTDMKVKIASLQCGSACVPWDVRFGGMLAHSLNTGKVSLLCGSSCVCLGQLVNFMLYNSRHTHRGSPLCGSPCVTLSFWGKKNIYHSLNINETCWEILC